MISNYSSPNQWLRWLPTALLIAAVAISVGCRTDAGDELSVPVELAALEPLEAVAQTEEELEADQAEEEARRLAGEREEEMRLAELELQQREARLREEARLLEERQALVLEQEQMAAREVEVEKRERETQERARELAAREAELAQGDGLSSAGEWQPSGVGEGSGDNPVAAKEPRVARESRFVETSLAAGTVLEVELLQTLSSRTARVGDSFSSRVARDVFSDDGVLAVPAGSEVMGRVTEARALRRVGGQASLGIEMDQLILPSGRSMGIHASMLELGRDKRRDKRKILAAAAAGAILGRILGSDGGSAVAGAAVGAAAGTAAVARAKGANVELPAGEIVAFRLEEVVTVTTEMTGLASSGK